VERAPSHIVRALKSVVEDSRHYSYELSIDYYGLCDISVECASYDSFRRLVSAIDENLT
jgi:hypothetical protein